MEVATVFQAHLEAHLFGTAVLVADYWPDESDGFEDGQDIAQMSLKLSYSSTFPVNLVWSSFSDSALILFITKFLTRAMSLSSVKRKRKVALRRWHISLLEVGSRWGSGCCGSIVLGSRWELRQLALMPDLALGLSSCLGYTRPPSALATLRGFSIFL